MPKILLDVTRLLSRLSNGLQPTGVDRVGIAYIQHYGHQAHAVLSEKGFSVVLTGKHSRRAFDLILSANRNRGVLAKLLGYALVDRQNRSQLADSVLLHTSHNGMEFGRYYRAMSKRRARTVFMVHDLIPLTHAEYCRAGVDQIHRRRIHTALAHADGLIANSNATLDSLRAEANNAGLRLPPTVVAHLAPGVAPRPLAAPLLDTPYFVMLGTIEPRKNHWFILHVWRTLVERMGNAAPKLVIIGRRGWECENVVDMLERCSILKGAVVEERDCPDDRLHALLQHARALLFPSFVEGYGLPLVEALMLRVPVIASDLAIFREISSDLPDYLDPLDGPGWLARILAYVSPTSPERTAQMARIAHFRESTWPEHFERVDTFLDALT
ncbi:glycosyltransferase family 1 protein [Burkholderia sp. SRS-46]|nr:glycosyltransferase family 1 protein [Burkholderia sp. SRS-46]